MVSSSVSATDCPKQTPNLCFSAGRKAVTGDSGSNERRAGRGQSESRAPEGTRQPPCRACALTFTLPPESGPNSAILLNILSQGRSRGRQERAQAGGVSRAEGFRLEVGESPGLAAPNCLLHTRGGAVGHSAPRWESGAEGVCGWGVGTATRAHAQVRRPQAYTAHAPDCCCPWRESVEDL